MHFLSKIFANKYLFKDGDRVTFRITTTEFIFM